MSFIANIITLSVLRNSMHWRFVEIHAFFISNAFFFNSASVLLNFFMNSASNVAQMMLILRQVLYVVYLGPCLSLGLFMPCLCDLFSISSLIFITINHITSFKQTRLIFLHFQEYLLLFLNDNVDEESE